MSAPDTVRPSTFTGTVSGRLLDLLAPDWLQVDLADVAHGLAQINRWNGQARRPISVLEHSLVVAELCPKEARLPALLHDAHEAYFGDVATPTARAIAALVGPRVRDAIGQLKHALDIAVARRVLFEFVDGDLLDDQGLVAEAELLASEMLTPTVKDADERSRQIEGSVRKQGSLQSHSPEIDHALSLFPVFRPDPGFLAERWLMDVGRLTRARFAERRA